MWFKRFDGLGGMVLITALILPDADIAIEVCNGCRIIGIEPKNKILMIWLIYGVYAPNRKKIIVIVSISVCEGIG